MLVNLWEETLQALKDNSFTLNGVKYICNAEGNVEMATFATSAENYWYDNESDEIGVDPTLCVVGSHWWLSRVRYKGVEKWMFHKKPLKPTIGHKEFIVNMKRPPGTLKEF